jgi:large subunit ribosomal protein L6
MLAENYFVIYGDREEKMSRIGKLPINIPKSVKVNLNNDKIIVDGPKGKLEVPRFNELEYKLEEGTLSITLKVEENKTKALWGLARSLLNNAVEGVSKGYIREMQIVGAGYRAQLQGKKLVINIGFSHPVEVEPPEGITFELKDPLNFSVSGIDKQKVGQVAANIRRIRPPEPYKLKGIRYKDEKLIQKERKLGAK